MKLPYKRGDSFALPLGNGQVARSCIVQCEHRVVVLAITIGEDDPLVLRVSDDALVLHRWKPDSRDLRPDAEALRAQNDYWIPAARAERLAAAALGAPHPRERRIAVREVHDDNLLRALGDINDDTILSLTHTLESSSLDRLCAAVHDHPGVTIRLHGGGLEHLDALSSTPLQRLTMGGVPSTLPTMPSIRELNIIGRCNLASIAAACPSVEKLSIDANAADIDLAPLASCVQLGSLDISAAHVLDAATFARLQELKSLRLSRVTGIRDTASIATLGLRSLAIEHLHELTGVQHLSALRRMEQLELLGLWQFDIGDVEWTVDHDLLLRVEIDIGGRRKNVELYRRTNWAYPWLRN